ncbi:Arylsulfatase A [Fodinibius roseus]|uniref:Arylsulfatase A n=1 Tax=Fodinibius roseus TaxID=1194090 RepID=A0A1M5KD57_9BACT|nr:sulfatase-like hydrolase/transferase [Fodinibius roseus]SHG50756.1 Arylsulfatase A [Fodinibius roseus]
MKDRQSSPLLRRIIMTGTDFLLSFRKQLAGRDSAIPAAARSIPVLLLSLVMLTIPVSAEETHLLTGNEEDNPPNIVVIMADDLGWNDIGYHNGEIRTPNLDRLAEGGVRLNQFYAYSTCSPTRVALQTGQNPARLNVFGPLGSTTDVQPEDMLLPFGLQQAGYSTHISGKWHIGDLPEHRPLRHGYTSSYGYLRGQIDPYTHRYKFGDYVTWHRNDHFVEEEGHVTRLITDEAIRVIETAGEVREEPFFLYVAHHAPHYPHNSPPKWIEPYQESFEDVWRRHTAAAITQMDHEIGRIITALEQTGQRENTLVTFMSDNGGQQSWSSPDEQYNGRYAAHSTLGDNRPLRGWKTDLYEGGIRVPALMNWPGVIPAGGEVDGPTHVLDVAPTLLRVADPDEPLPRGLEGRNLWPVLTGGESETELNDRRFYWRQSDLRALREGDWKVIARGEALEDPELFNLADDPHENSEIGEEYPDKRKELLDKMRQWEGEEE